MNRIKDKSKEKIKSCTNCFNPVYLKFNFTYITYDDYLDKEHINKLWQRMRELSKEKYTVISGRGKEVGFECIPVKISKKIPAEFSERFPTEAITGKFNVMRLYTNNNPLPSRIIGKLVRNVFYIFYIDIKGKLYKH